MYFLLFFHLICSKIAICNCTHVPNIYIYILILPFHRSSLVRRRSISYLHVQLLLLLLLVHRGKYCEQIPNVAVVIEQVSEYYI